jgi:hypothetical protein
MSDAVKDFWLSFNGKNMAEAQIAFDKLSSNDKQSIFENLFQNSCYQRTPDILSVLYRELDTGKTFNDFHQAWFPGKQWCDPVEISGYTFQKFFPAPTRVFNAINMHNENEVVSVGLTWFDNEEQAKSMQKFAMSESEANQYRANNIDKVSKKISADVYFVKSDDNLGSPF